MHGYVNEMRLICIKTYANLHNLGAITFMCHLQVVQMDADGRTDGLTFLHPYSGRT